MTRNAIVRSGSALALLVLSWSASAWPAAAQGIPALSAFRQRHPGDWTVTADAASGRPRRLVGGAVDLALTSPTPDALLAAVRAVLVEAAPALELDPLTLTASPQDIVASRDGVLVVVHFDVAPRGVPIDGARVTVVVSHGRVIAIHAVGTEPLDADPVPRFTADEALTIALARAGFGGSELAAPAAPVLRFVRDSGPHLAPRLAWKLTLIRNTPPDRHVAFVDAQDGALLSLTDETVEACTPAPPGVAAGSVLGGVRPHRADDPERSELLAGVSVGGTVSDTSGRFAPQPAPASATLSGPVDAVECVSCTNPESPRATLNATDGVDFGSGGSDATGNGQATPADRTSFFHVERAHRMATRWLSLPWLDAPVAIRTNLPSACNAFWNGVALNFFRSSPTCSNTGEIRDVISHEWGHALDQNDGLPTAPLAVDAATGEAVADVVALLRGRDSCIGESFFLDASDFPSANCSGVRDVDAQAPGHRHGLMTATTALVQCSASPFYRGVLGREGHCEGEIFGQTVWHLVRTLESGRSYGDGRALAPALGNAAAWQVAEAIFFRSRSMLASYAPSTLQSIGLSAHDAFLLADDEGDGIANGTPHAWAIDDAFAHHQIAEPGPARPLAAPCAVTAPIASVTAIVDGALGRAIQRVTWNDSGAASYEVLRDDADSGGLQAIAAVFGPGPGSFDDAGMLPGRVARYVVVARNASGCLAPSTAVLSAGFPSLRISALRLDDSVTGDADGRLTTGETVDVSLDLTNDGTAQLTAVTVTLEPEDPELAIVAGGPLSYGTIGIGATSPAPSAFRVRALPTAGSFVTLTIAAESVEGCLRARWLIPIARPELVLTAQVVDDSAGNADGTWDPAETIELGLSLRDDGLFPARAVSGTLSFRGAPPPGVTLPQANGAWLDINVGTTVPSTTPGFRLAATALVPRGTPVLLDLDVSIGGVPHARYPLVLIVGGVATGQLEWEIRTELFSPDGTGQIVNQFIVAQTNDDDNDGLITGCDVPDIIFEMWNVNAEDQIVVVSGDDGRVLRQFSVSPCRTGWDIFQSLAAADVDGDGVPEILTDGGGRPCAFELDGSLLWRTPMRAWTPEFTPGHCAAAPQVWDLDGNGTPEVIIGRAVLNGSDGTVLYTDTARRDTGRSLVGDIDADGDLDVVSYRGDVRDAAGNVTNGIFPGFWQFGGLVNLDADPEAEVVYLATADQATPSVVARDTDGTLLWEWVNEPGHDLRPPMCFGDFDGDGRAETAFPAGSEMLLFDDDGSILWRLPTNDSSGASGCSVFDFDDDGRPEIVYRDEANLKVIHGTAGIVLWQTACASQTQYEFPIVADVTRDGRANIVVSSNLGGNRSLLRVYGNQAWPSARGVWNQEEYSVTHVTEDGHAVTAPASRWLTANDFRGQSKGCPCGGPTLDVSVDVPCDTSTACFTAGVAGGTPPMDLTWDFGDGTPPRVAANPCHDYAPGRYLATVTLVDDATCSAESAVVVVVPERLGIVVTGQPTCAGLACLSALVSGGTPPTSLEWDFDDGSTATGDMPCHDFVGPSLSWHVVVRDAAGCLAEASGWGSVNTTPASVGGTLFVTNHSNPLAPAIDATLDWRLDAGAPRPLDESYRLLRGELPTVLARIPGTAGQPTPTYRESTPASGPLPHVYFYVVLAEDGCGLVSPD